MRANFNLNPIFVPPSLARPCPPRRGRVPPARIIILHPCTALLLLLLLLKAECSGQTESIRDAFHVFLVRRSPDTREHYVQTGHLNGLTWQNAFDVYGRYRTHLSDVNRDSKSSQPARFHFPPPEPHRRASAPHVRARGSRGEGAASE